MRRGILWCRRLARRLRLKRSESDVLAFICSYCDPAYWRGFRICIEVIAEKLYYARSTIEKALYRLRELGLITRAGTIPVKHGRYVVVYDMGPEFPLPEDVSEAREAVRECPWDDDEYGADQGASRSGAENTYTKYGQDDRHSVAINASVDGYIDLDGSEGFPQDQNPQQAQTDPKPQPGAPFVRSPHFRKTRRTAIRLARKVVREFREQSVIKGENVVTWGTHPLPVRRQE